MVRTLALLAITVLAVGCKGGEAPTNGDNPGAANAVSSDAAPNASRRGAPSSTGRQERMAPQAPRPSMKGS